ncbi:cytochrome b5 domain-containing protein 1 [Harmonia axyridis]|uniref:cytochrome b5 domain-containing protein 1 n=1 Tax=Harmonia axyridis TaxID=115357 RepID=UPI001E276887|nr:cytochrome b5 domain-containing protein 1 [Harmonia axyridis]
MNLEKKKLPYIAPFEVVVHNKATDCWVSVLGKVFDITPLIKQYEGQACVKPLIALAGKDLSHWFDAKTGAIRHRIHPVTGVLTPYCPNGAFPDVQCQVPDSQWRAINGPPWWDRPQYQIGILTKRVRSLKIINMLTFHEVQINVCCEDTFRRIQERYSIFNKDPDSYAWRYFDQEIDLDKTMDENGIVDDRDKFTEFGMPQNFYIPVVFLFYKDDLKYSQGEEESFTYYKDLSDDKISGIGHGVPYRILTPTFQSIDPCVCDDIEEEEEEHEVDVDLEKYFKQLSFQENSEDQRV